MECSVCKKRLEEKDNPRLYDVFEVRDDGELGTGFRLAFCPPSKNNCEELFRSLAEKRGLAMVPVESTEA